MNFTTVEIDFYYRGIDFYHRGNRFFTTVEFFFLFFSSPRGHSINQMEIQV